MMYLAEAVFCDEFACGANTHMKISLRNLPYFDIST